MADSRLIVEGVDPKGRKMSIWHVVFIDGSSLYSLHRARGAKSQICDEIDNAVTQDEICEKALAWDFSGL